ncbi:hypothetical protein R5R35_011509 [Gryllus longicercus]|uniref:Ribosome assembly factor mrt4 n=1 Tax=Gryllus longicercus TaxID=2509291 RepID=A0AAN9V158_9ORTH|nr:Ribosome assembly factor mrt4 [Gryllus bimaculatus]
MPKSKRDKKISLTKTKKKDLQFKQQLMDEIRRCVENFSNIFVFSVKNMRNAKLKELRSEWRHSRFFFGKNKVMALGLGLTAETEVQDNLHKLAKQLTGQCGLLFTNKERDEVLEWFDNYSETDYARTGCVATKTVVLPAGPLEQFPHSMEPQLRQLGLPTSLTRGVVTLIEDTVVCQEGKPLKSEQARMLKLLGNQMAAFRLIMKCIWSKGGTFEKFSRKRGLQDVVMEQVEQNNGSNEEEEKVDEDEDENGNDTDNVDEDDN